MKRRDLFQLEFDASNGFPAAVDDVNVDEDDVATYPDLAMQTCSQFDFSV